MSGSALFVQIIDPWIGSSSIYFHRNSSHMTVEEIAPKLVLIVCSKSVRSCRIFASSKNINGHLVLGFAYLLDVEDLHLTRKE